MDISKLYPLTAEAEKRLETVPESWSIVAVRAASGKVYTTARTMDRLEMWRAELELVEELSDAGDGFITELIVLCKGGALEVPGWHLRGMLLALDERNGDAKVLLRGRELLEKRLADLK